MDSPIPIYHLLCAAPPGSGWGDAAVPAFLSPIERERLAGLRFPRRRKSWLLGRWAAKSLLQTVLPGVPALAEIQIENEAGGAPFAQVCGQPLDGCLTVSHREDQALAAYTPHPGLRIGADMEIVPAESPDFLSDYLSLGELEIVARLRAGERARWMILAWSAKEAVLKALRIGLRADTRSVEILEAAEPPPGAWTPLAARSSLPGTGGLRLWWQMQGDLVLTLAAVDSQDAVRFQRVSDPSGGSVDHP